MKATRNAESSEQVAVDLVEVFGVWQIIFSIVGARLLHLEITPELLRDCHASDLLVFTELDLISSSEDALLPNVNNWRGSSVEGNILRTRQCA